MASNAEGNEWVLVIYLKFTKAMKKTKLTIPPLRIQKNLT